jgi:hypothetical protein
MRVTLTTLQIISIATVLLAAYMILDTWEFIGAIGLSGLVVTLIAELTWSRNADT